MHVVVELIRTNVDNGAGTGGETAAVDVEKIVNAKCISCHGGNLEGGGAPALDKIGAKLSYDEIHDIIINGVRVECQLDLLLVKKP